MNGYSLTYRYLGRCGDSQVPAKYVVDNLDVCKIRVNTHTHTHTFSPRVFYKKHLRNQSIGKTLFQVFAGNSLEFKYTKWCSAPPVAAVSLCPYTALPHGMTSVRR